MLILTNLLHFLMTYIWDALNVNVKTNDIIIENRDMFESRISAGATENYLGGKNLLRGPTTWKDMLKNALSDIVNWRTKRQSSFSKSQVLVWVITNSRRKNLNQLEKLSEVCSQIVLKWSQIVLQWLYLARIGGPDVLWSVNKLARAVARDRRLASLISYIQHTNNNRQYCHVGKTAQHCRLA